MKQRLVRSAFLCLTCGTIVESKHRDDYAECACQTGSDTAIFVSGGLRMQRVGYGIRAEFEDVSEWEDFEE